jgi:hypothetical protein
MELRGENMRDRCGITLSLALALALTVTCASAAGPARPRPIGKAGPLLQAQPFLVSGEFTGPIGGEIRIDGVSYRLATDALVYEIGKGVVPLGTVVDGRVLCLSGLKRPEIDVAMLGTDPSSHIHVVEGPIPQ